MDEQRGRTPTGPISVLICDDVEAIRGLLAELIDSHDGLRVAGSAENGEEAIAEAQRLQPDVILLDLSMPVLTGLDALPEIKLAAPRAKVIVLSGFAAEMIAADALAHGADRFLEKGAHPDVITAAIEEAVAESGLPVDA
jgi:DNA-binding NarL/FixJ family response regulator